MKSFLPFFILSVILLNAVYAADSEESKESESSESSAQSQSNPQRPQSNPQQPNYPPRPPSVPQGGSYYITENYEVSNSYPEGGQPLEEFSVQFSPAAGPGGSAPRPFPFSQRPFPSFPSSPFPQPFRGFGNAFPPSPIVRRFSNFGPFPNN